MVLPNGGSKRLKGNALSLKIDQTDFWMDVTSCKVTNDDADSKVVTFYDAANGGGKAYTLEITAIQSLDPTSFWSYAWDNVGKTVPYVYAPKGVADAPTPDAPWFVGNVTIGAPPELGGDAGEDEEYTTDLKWKLDGKPTKVTSAAELATALGED